MDFNLLISELLQKLQDTSAAAEAYKNEIREQMFNEGKAAGDAEGYNRGLSEGDAAGYARGFEDGKNSVVIPNDETPFSQADVDAKVLEAVMPLNEKIAQLEARIVELEARPVGPTPEEVEAIKNEAIVAVKSDIKSKLDEFEVNFLS